MIRALRIFLWMAFLTGVLYPFFITFIAHLTMPKQSRGTLIIENGKIIGSARLGQQFVSEIYFRPRPSACHYNCLPAYGSNLGPTNRKLKEEVEKRRKHWGEKGKKVPDELLFASGSGLDPHITREGAYFQIERIAQARNVSPEKIRDLIDRHIKAPRWGFLGESRINVLLLNLSLDKEIPHGKNG